MLEVAVVVIVLPCIAFLILWFNEHYISTRLWRTLLWWKAARMDVRSEERAWERVADAALDSIDNQFLAGDICSELRDKMLTKLQRSPGLGFQFSPRNIQRTLKEVIRGRLGTHTTPRFPDPGPYVFAYSSIDDRAQTIVLLKLRTSKWRTKVP
jgi:hypothetical protein